MSDHGTQSNRVSARTQLKNRIIRKTALLPKMLLYAFFVVRLFCFVIAPIKGVATFEFSSQRICRTQGKHREIPLKQEEEDVGRGFSLATHCKS